MFADKLGAAFVQKHIYFKTCFILQIQRNYGWKSKMEKNMSKLVMCFIRRGSI